MILKIYTIFDSKAEAYLPPFFVQSKGLAIRAFSDAANDASHQFGKYPADFTLFELGEFEDSIAAMHLHLTPHPVGKAIEFCKVVPLFDVSKSPTAVQEVAKVVGE